MFVPGCAMPVAEPPNLSCVNVPVGYSIDAVIVITFVPAVSSVTQLGQATLIAEMSSRALVPMRCMAACAPANVVS